MNNNLLARQFVQRAIDARAELAMLEAEIELLRSRRKALRQYVEASDQLAERLLGERSAALSAGRAVEAHLRGSECGLPETPAAHGLGGQLLPASLGSGIAQTPSALAPVSGARAAEPADAATIGDGPAADEPTPFSGGLAAAKLALAKPSAAVSAVKPGTRRVPSKGKSITATATVAETARRQPVPPRGRRAIPAAAIVELHHQGRGLMAIARELNVDPKTVRKYIVLGQELPRQLIAVPSATESMIMPGTGEASAPERSPAAESPADEKSAARQADPQTKPRPGRPKAPALAAPATAPVRRGPGRPRKVAPPATMINDATAAVHGPTGVLGPTDNALVAASVPAVAPVQAAVSRADADEQGLSQPEPRTRKRPGRKPRQPAVEGTGVSSLRDELADPGRSLTAARTRGRGNAQAAPDEASGTKRTLADDAAPAVTLSDASPADAAPAAPGAGLPRSQIEDAVLGVLRDHQPKLVAIGDIAVRARKRLGVARFDTTPGSVLESLRRNGLVERVGHKWRVAQHADELRALFTRGTGNL